MSNWHLILVNSSDTCFLCLMLLYKDKTPAQNCRHFLTVMQALTCINWAFEEFVQYIKNLPQMMQSIRLFYFFYIILLFRKNPHLDNLQTQVCPAVLGSQSSSDCGASRNLMRGALISLMCNLVCSCTYIRLHSVSYRNMK